MLAYLAVGSIVLDKEQRLDVSQDYGADEQRLEHDWLREP
jgi:hypothetical protein